MPGRRQAGHPAGTAVAGYGPRPSYTCSPLNDKPAPYREIPSRKADRVFFAGTARNALSCRGGTCSVMAGTSVKMGLQPRKKGRPCHASPSPRAYPAKIHRSRSAADALAHGLRIQPVQAAHAQTVQAEAHPQGQAVTYPEAGGAMAGTSQSVRARVQPVPSPTIQ